MREIEKAREGPLGGLRGADGMVSSGNRPDRTLRQRNAVVASAFDVWDRTVLDLGCAEGLHSLYLAFHGGRVLGVDHRESVIARAKATQAHLGISGAEFILADARERSFWCNLQPVNLAIAWGLIHRVADVFSLLGNLASISEVISLEWRTPIGPSIESASFAVHSTKGDALDPMNLTLARSTRFLTEEKIEGQTGFWEPTPAAVKAILSRMGFPHARVVGYGEALSPLSVACMRTAFASAVRRKPLRNGRVHMLFARHASGLEYLRPTEPASVPDWDEAMRQRLRYSH